ncbi:unnamed protein product [Musa acuminata subsp. burmannicoides]
MAPGLSLLRPPSRCGSYFDDSQPEHEQASALMVDKPNKEAEEEEDDKIRREAEAMATSKVDRGNKYEGWLQLGIGGGCRPNGSHSQHPSTMDPSSSNSKAKGDLVELDLFCRRPALEPPPSPLTAFPAMAPWFPAVMGGYCHQLTPSGCTWMRSSNPSLSSGEMRVVSLPRRKQTGVWFVLQAAHDQVKEPFLPQIPKSYLRIKDGRMTIRLLMKYLANKLVLEDESQVVITCRGQQLPPYMTLMYVRDNIWCSPEAVELNSDSSSSKYIMNLLYGRSRCG